MIEKLDLDNGYTTIDWLPSRHGQRCAAKEIQTTVNQLVAAINNQQIQLNNHECRLLDLHRRITALDDPTYHEAEPEPADPYSEHRKWIGCLCRFWFDNKKQADIGILGDIDEDEIHPYFNADLGHNYKYCEPVKPDDDIIYKGGDNEK